MVTEIEISIHAPVKGATSHRVRLHLLRQISIHAPVKGATVDRQRRAALELFQSTHP